MLNVNDYIKDHIRTVPDWPQAGVEFRDITPLLQDPKVFRVLIDIFLTRYRDAKLDLIAGLDARGFILGSVVAYELNIGFVPIRKKGKLPFTTVSESYELEYGSAGLGDKSSRCLERHKGATPHGASFAKAIAFICLSVSQSRSLEFVGATSDSAKRSP